MKIEWKSIRDERPEQNSIIVQLNEPSFQPYDTPDFKGDHFSLGMREYVTYETWENYLKWCDDNGARVANYWWVYAKDFPFPNLEVPESLKE